MDKISYQEYLQSDHWKRIREEALNRDGRRCQICGSENNLHVHHLRYKYLTCEYVSDLVVLCEDCHHKLHLNINNVKSLQYEMECRWRGEAAGLLSDLAKKYRAESAFMTAKVAANVLDGKKPINTSRVIKIIRDTLNNRAGEGDSDFPISPECSESSYTMACQIFSRIKNKNSFETWMNKAYNEVVDIYNSIKAREAVK